MYQKRAYSDNSPETAKYRELYEGSQRSLRDMTLRQTDAIERVGKLKAKVVRLCTQFLPEMVERLEEALGTKVADHDDATMFMLLEKVLEALEDRSGRMNLSSALSKVCGSAVTPGSYTEMAEKVSEAGPIAAKPAAQLDATPLFEDDEPALVEVASAPEVGTQEAPQEDAPESHGMSIDDLFADDEVASAIETPSALDGMFEPTREEAPLPDGDLEDLFADDYGDEHYEDPRDSETAPDDVDDFFGGEGFDALPAKEDAPGKDAPGKAAPKSLYGQPTPTIETPKPKAKKKPRRAATAAKPTLLDVPTAERPADTAVEVSDEARDAARELLAAPMPVYFSDLVELFGDAATADAWVKEENDANPRTVQLVQAPTRGDSLGQLVFPAQVVNSADEEWRTGPWPTAMGVYLGKDLHRVGSVVRYAGTNLSRVAAYTPEVASIRLQRPHGTVAVIVALTDDNDAVVAAVAEAITEDLVQLAVLTYPSNAKSNAPLVDALDAASSNDSWTVRCAVIVSEASQWLAGTGTGDLVMAP